MSSKAYQVFLLRLWRPSESGPWHTMIQEAGNEQRYAFTQLQELIRFLEERMRDPEVPEPPPPPS